MIRKFKLFVKKNNGVGLFGIHNVKTYDLLRKRFVVLENLNANKESSVTLYIKGFLNDNDTNSYKKWKHAHNDLIDAGKWKHNDVSLGYYWNSAGDINYLPTSPILVSSMEFYKYGRFAFGRIPYLFAVTSLAESIILGYMLYKIYKKIDFDIDVYAGKLKDDIVQLKSKYKHVRIVAHSLGCQLLMNAVHNLGSSGTGNSLPDEIHMCAPAFIENDYLKELKMIDDSSCKMNIYWSEYDFILGHLYYLLQSDEPVGSKGMDREYKNIKAYDVTKHLGPMVHMSYASNFTKFVK